VGSIASNDTAVQQAQVRQATLRIGDLIGTCKLLCAAPGNDLVIWRTDDNADNQINVNELVYVERGNDCDFLRLCQFTSADNPAIALRDLALPATKSQFQSNSNPRYTILVPQCKDVGFAFYPATPPLTQATCLSISLTLAESAGDQHYEIVTALQGRAANLLNQTGDALVATDDD
jgi:hypothetical protein